MSCIFHVDRKSISDYILVNLPKTSPQHRKGIFFIINTGSTFTADYTSIIHLVQQPQLHFMIY